MNTSLRLSLTAGAVAVGLVGLSYLLANGTPQASAEEATEPTTLNWTDPWRKADEIEVRLQIAARKLEAKRRLVEEVIAGRLPLLEAAARFRDLDRAHADFAWGAFRRLYPDQTDDERHCRSVIDSAESELCRRPSQAAVVVARLKAELQEHLEYGPVCLPAVQETK